MARAARLAFKQGRSETTVYFGLDLQAINSPDDFNNPLRGTHVGVRFAADVWLEPADMMMVSTAFLFDDPIVLLGRAQLRAHPGVGWVGPEAHVFSDLAYHEYSIIHLASSRPPSSMASVPAMSSTRIAVPNLPAVWLELPAIADHPTR